MRTSISGKPGSRHRLRPFLLRSVQSRSAPCPPACTKSAQAGDVHRTQHSRARHTDRRRTGTPTCAHKRQLVRKDACTLTEEQWGPAQPWSPDPPRLSAHPLHLQDGFPARCSYHAPNKSQLIGHTRRQSLHRNIATGPDKLQRGGASCLSSDSCCRCSHRGAACRPAAPAPLSIMRGSQAGDRPLLRFGFQLGELQPQAA